MTTQRELDADQERLLDAIVLAAENEGDFYKDRDAKGAVAAAWRLYRRATITNLDYDYEIVQKLAEKMVRKTWGRPKRR